VQQTGGSGNWAGGTVGAVARDHTGAVAAATSTGGMVGKHRGRVGDSPIIGAGAYADDQTGAASATGEGEAFLKLGVCLRACDALGAPTSRSPEEAARWAITLVGTRLAATGGLILVDREGRLGLARNTVTMSWAATWDGGDASGT
jgi:beta-aspartyl-peptidase (threonine type)